METHNRYLDNGFKSWSRQEISYQMVSMKTRISFQYHIKSLAEWSAYLNVSKRLLVDSWQFHNFKRGASLEWGPPSLMRINGQLLDMEVVDLIKKVNINRSDK